MQPCTPLGYLFIKACIPGHMSYGESGTRFSLQRREGETILIFRIDEGRSRASLGNQRAETFSRHFDVRDDEPRSDLMLLYLRGKENEDNVVRLALLELKGNDHGKAVEQLGRTLDAVKTKLSPLLGTRFFDSGTLRAFIVSRSGPPQRFKDKQLAFQKKWGFAPQVCRAGDEQALRKHLE